MSTIAVREHEWLRALRAIGRARLRGGALGAERWGDALRELARVHRIEQAELVRRARRLARAAATPEQRRAWRRAALEEVRAARADGFEPSWRLLACLARGAGRSSSARRAGRPGGSRHGGGASAPADAPAARPRASTPDPAVPCVASDVAAGACLRPPAP